VIGPVLALLLATPALAGPCGSSADLLPAPYDALVRGEEALEAGRSSEAITELEAAESVLAGPAARRRLQLLGRARLAVGQPAQKDLLGALDGVSKPGHRASTCDADPAETRWWLAQAESELPRIERYKELWIHNPTSPRSAQAEEKLRAHAPGFPTRDDVLARAATLASMHQHKSALALLEERVTDDGSKEHALMMSRAMFRAKDYPRAVDAIGAIANAPLQDRFDRALGASRTGDYAFAAELYQAIVDEHASARTQPKLVDTASYKLGYLDYDKGRLEAGVAGFQAHLKRFPKSAHRTEALWFVGWSLFKLDRSTEAADAFASLVNEHPTSTLVPGARYWQARIAGIQGDADAERAGMEQVLVRHSDTSYAWWASRRLGRTWEPPIAPQAPIGTVFDDDPRLARGFALQRAGVDDWAAAELGQLVSAARKKGRDHTIYLAIQLAEAGQWNRARAMARPWCTTPEARKDLTALKLCWPRPEGDAVLAAATQGGLPPHLPFAIMKAESGFNPTVTSPAGARGLMQMMPKLGVALWAETHDGAVLNPAALYDPVVNSELGVAELSALRASLADTGVDPVVPLVIAGYNGGEAAVRRWLASSSGPIEADRWAEDISYSETRRYVRRVLGALQVYRYIYGD
jgi:soluble lytic murein transglycosylase